MFRWKPGHVFRAAGEEQRASSGAWGTLPTHCHGHLQRNSQPSWVNPCFVLSSSAHGAQQTPEEDIGLPRFVQFFRQDAALLPKLLTAVPCLCSTLHTYGDGFHEFPLLTSRCVPWDGTACSSPSIPSSRCCHLLGFDANRVMIRNNIPEQTLQGRH